MGATGATILHWKGHFIMFPIGHYITCSLRAFHHVFHFHNSNVREFSRPAAAREV